MNYNQKNCRQVFSMRQRGQTFTSKRQPLGQISDHFYNNLSTISEQKEKYCGKELSLNEKEAIRLKQLKNKYQNLPKQTEQKSFNQLKSKEQTVDRSFQRIQISELKINDQNYSKNHMNSKPLNLVNQQNSNTHNNSKTFKKSIYHKNFQKKIEQSNQRVESNISRVEDKLDKIKGMFKFDNDMRQNSLDWKKNKSKNDFRSYQEFNDDIQNFDRNDDFINKKTQKVNREKLELDVSQTQKQSDKSGYAQQLKSINFVDEIKRKIMQIEHEKKSNIQKKVTELSRTSKLTDNDFEEQHIEQSQQKTHFTLAKLTPNLAESEIIETTQRERFTERDKEPSKRNTASIESLVIKNYKFSNENATSRMKYNHNDRILEEPEIEDMSLRASPIQAKSPYCETNNLDETQLVQRNSLQGDFSTAEEEVQRQFALLINRLAYQAEIDNKFACEIFKYDNIFTQKQSLKNVMLAKLKQHFKQNGLPYNESLFEVSQMQIDPLMSVQKVYQDYLPENIMKLGFGLKKLCDKNCAYFEKKLSNCFGSKTIDFFVEELQKCHSLKSNEDFNVGHLTSYINMRTGKNLRNRYFYRLLKRIVKDKNKIGSTFKKEELIEAFVKH